MKNETKVGIAIILGAVVFATSVFILSGIRILEKGYQINILFGDIQGLLKQAKVQVAGVNVGYVKDITLVGEKAKVTIWVERNVNIHKGTNAFIFSSGIIGVKFIQLTPGDVTQALLKDNDTITGIDPVSIDKMFEKTQSAVNSLIDSLKSITSDSSIKAIIDNLNKFSQDLNGITGDFKVITRDMKDISKSVKKYTTDGRMDNIVKRLDLTITSMEKISKSIDNGDGALGKLVGDKKMGTDLKDAISSLKVFARMMQNAPSGWIVNDKKAKDVKKQIEKEENKK